MLKMNTISVILLVLIIPFFMSVARATDIVVMGSVLEDNREPVFAANIYLKTDLNIGTQSDIGGSFTLYIPKSKDNDTIIVSAIGFKNKEILIKKVAGHTVEIILEKELYTLDDVIVKSRSPISSFYTMSEVGRFDIYMNPLAQGDVLTAITTLPSSSSVDETSSPSLRGSAGSASLVTLNGVPIQNPSKTNTINNHGIFGIFNPEIIDKEYVYPSNPPLTYGNTTAGMVEIETSNKFNNNKIQIGANLSGFNLLLSKKIKNSVFFHVFGNILSSSLMKVLEPNSLPEVISFNTKDIGTSLYWKINKNTEFRTYNYFNGDKYKGIYNMYAYDDDIAFNNQRLLTINNLKYFFNKAMINISQGWEHSKSKFQFGNFDLDDTYMSNFISLYYKALINNNFIVQSGVEYRNSRFKFNDVLPYFYYALAPDSPKELFNGIIINSVCEHYMYTSYDFSDKIASSFSIRYDLPLGHNVDFFSYQVSIKYSLNPNNNILLGAGKYHRYKDPSTYYPSFNLVSSSQYSIDYTYKRSNLTAKGSLYYKRSHEDICKDDAFDLKIADVYTKGVEASIKYSFLDHFDLFCSNSFIHQRLKSEKGKWYHGNYNIKYHIKSSLTYSNSKLGSFSLAYTTRPGIPSTAIMSASYDDNLNVNIPVWGEYNASMMPKYSRVDFSYNNVINLKTFKFLYYMSVYNIFNKKNVMDYIYNSDYTIREQRLFQKRMFFMGMVFSF